MSQSSLFSNNTLFLGDLSKFCVEDDLVPLFGQFGEILEIRIMRNSSTGKALSYGFVRFQLYDCAATALESLNGLPFQGRHLRIGWAAHNVKAPRIEESVVNSVHVRFSTPQVDVYITEETIHDVFNKYGSVTDVSIKQSAIDPRTGTQSGYGFVHFTDGQAGVEAAITVLTSLNNTNVEGVNYSVEPSKNLLKQLNEMNARKGMSEYGSAINNRFQTATRPGSFNHYRQQHHFSLSTSSQGRQHYRPQQQMQKQPVLSNPSFEVPAPRQFGFPEDRPFGHDPYTLPTASDRQFQLPAPAAQAASHLQGGHRRSHSDSKIGYPGSDYHKAPSFQAAYAPVQPPQQQAYPASRRSPTLGGPVVAAVHDYGEADSYYSRSRSATSSSTHSFEAAGSVSGLQISAPASAPALPPRHGPAHTRSISLGAVRDFLGHPGMAFPDTYDDFGSLPIEKRMASMANLRSLRAEPAPYVDHIGAGAAGGENYDWYSTTVRSARASSVDGSSPALSSRESINSSRYSVHLSSSAPYTNGDNSPRGAPMGPPSAAPSHQLVSSMERLGLEDGPTNFSHRPPLTSGPSASLFSYQQVNGYAASQSQEYTSRRPSGDADLEVSYGALYKSEAPPSLSSPGATDGERGFFNSTSSSFVGESSPRGAADGSLPGTWMQGASHEPSSLLSLNGGISGISLSHTISPRSASLQRKGIGLIEDEHTYLSNAPSNGVEMSAASNASITHADGSTPNLAENAPSVLACPAMGITSPFLGSEYGGEGCDQGSDGIAAKDQGTKQPAEQCEKVLTAVASPAARESDFAAKSNKPKSRQATLTQYFKAVN